jgi:putative tryptophan/tyrosine transport system substrate-binding protein
MQFDRLKRREFITLLGGAPVWPLAAGAQQRAMPVIGLLSGVSLESYADRIASFRQGLKDAGFVEGQNVVIEYRAADGHAELLAALAADLVDRQVSVIVAIAGITAIKAISTIPIVFATGADPIVAGLVKSLSRPGGNVTGVTGLGMELGPKRLARRRGDRVTAVLFTHCAGLQLTRRCPPQNVSECLLTGVTRPSLLPSVKEP